MQLKKVLIFILPLIIFFQGSSQDIESLVAKGNQLYSDGNYEKAIQTWEELTESGYEAAPIYYNLGNAYFKSNKIAPAILNYERAKILAPHDKNINYNLELAQTYIVDKIDELPEVFYLRWYNNIVQRFSSNTWAIITIIAFVIFLVFFSIYLYAKSYSSKKTAFWFSTIFLLIWLCAFAFFWSGNKLVTDNNKAIVFSPSVTVLSSPDRSGTELFVIHEGTKVTVIDELNEWTEILLSSGTKGWLLSSSIEKI
ncbi:MAG: tetratricopeptide repeat protein [Bacteroidetes bacterium]|nr:tetratricopeptide repeat protein [Bacteroidota bacterium]